MKELRKRIRAYRIQEEISQAEFIRRGGGDDSISNVTSLSKIESGSVKNPRSTNRLMPVIQKALGLSDDELKGLI